MPLGLDSLFQTTFMHRVLDFCLITLFLAKLQLLSIQMAQLSLSKYTGLIIVSVVVMKTLKFMAVAVTITIVSAEK